MTDKNKTLKETITDPRTLEKDGEINLKMDDISLDMGSINLGEEQDAVKDYPENEKFGDEMKRVAGAELLAIREKEAEWRKTMALECTGDFYGQIIFRSSEDLHKWFYGLGIKLNYGDFCFIEDLEEALKKKYGKK